MAEVAITESSHVVFDMTFETAEQVLELFPEALRSEALLQQVEEALEMAKESYRNNEASGQSEEVMAASRRGYAVCVDCSGEVLSMGSIECCGNGSVGFHSEAKVS